MDLHRTASILYLIAGAACLCYYVSLRLYIPTGVNMGWIWPAAGAALIAVGLVSMLALPGWLRVAWRVLFGVGLAGFLALEGVVLSGMWAKLPANVDAIVVLGARVHADGRLSQALTHRVDAAADYLAANQGTICIVSGGQGPDEPTSEAVAMRDALIERGTDPERIVMEDRSADTRENLIYSKELLPENAANVGIVTNNFHVARALMLARSLGYDRPKGLAAEFTGGALPHFMVREAIGLAYERMRTVNN